MIANVEWHNWQGQTESLDLFFKLLLFKFQLNTRTAPLILHPKSPEIIHKIHSKSFQFDQLIVSLLINIVPTNKYQPQIPNARVSCDKQKHLAKFL